MKHFNKMMFIVLASVLLFAGVGNAITDRLGAPHGVDFNHTKAISKTADYTVTTTDLSGALLINCTATSSQTDLTLPAITSLNGNRSAIKLLKTDSSSYACAFAPASGNTVGGESARLIVDQNSYIVIQPGSNNNWEVAFESSYITPNHETGALTFAGINSTDLSSDFVVIGTTPTGTFGDNGAEDTGIVFDATQDYYFQVDDTGGLAEDILTIGLGSVVGTTPILSFNATQQMILEEGETLENTTDDTVAITSNDTHTNFLIRGFEASNAVLTLSADQADDAVDTWTDTVADGGARTIANGGTATLSINEVVAFGSGTTSVPVVVTDAASYSVTVANSGKVHIIGDLSQNTAIVLPAEAAGLNYRFIYAAAAVEVHDHTIDTEADVNYFIGGVSFADTDAGDAADEIHAGVYSDANSNSKLTINNAAAGTVIDVWCQDGTTWYVTGSVYSDTVPAFADQ